MGRIPYRNGETKAPAKCNAPVKSPPPLTATAKEVGGTRLIATASNEKLSFRGQGSSFVDVKLEMILSYSSANDMVHAMHEPTKADAENAVNIIHPAPLAIELSRPPPSTAKHQAMYIAMGKKDPNAMATVDFVLSKLSNLTMDGTMFW